jgi:hypothetical protein
MRVGDIVLYKPFQASDSTSLGLVLDVCEAGQQPLNSSELCARLVWVRFPEDPPSWIMARNLIVVCGIE